MVSHQEVRLLESNSLVEMIAQHSNLRVKARLDRLRAALTASDQELRAAQTSRPGEEDVRVAQRVRRRLSPEQETQLVALYRAGTTTYQLSAGFGISRRMVSLILGKHGIPLRNQPLSAGQVEEAISLYASGLSLARVGEKLGCHAATVRSALIRAGVATRDSHGRER